MVQNASQEGMMQALDELCRLYWRPLQAYCMSLGKNATDTEDLTQSFFAHLLSGDGLRLACPERGKFRTFLLTSFKNHMADLHRRSLAMKRGGGAAHISLSAADPSGPLHAMDEVKPPDLAFDKQWAEDLVSRAKQALLAEYRAAGKQDWYEAVTQGVMNYAACAIQLCSTEQAVKAFAHRVRVRFRERLEQQIADTVSTPEEAAAEMKYLAELLRS
jgi:DNA-directed RNA polymerase specialized sigma24 family protein